MQKIEILAPSGGMDSLVAAIRSGADAVYLGATDFSARSSAKNFSYEELCEAIDYCHIHGKKAYLTLNTLIADSEMQRALDLATYACNQGIDALIIQDVGLARLLRKHLPQLRLHGSTQMSIHTPSGAKLLWEAGFKRVVLSRELSLDEIREIAESCPIELEVFVHGALCMSVSGQCYFSAMLGSRSGNRGMCAQPCRLPFSLSGGSDYSLSLKDNSLINHLPKLEELGITSAKIEGRMKRPEYVSAATKAAKEMRDLGFVSDTTQEELQCVFSRTGFTDGYLLGKRNKDMFGYRRKEDVIQADNALLSRIRQGYKDEISDVPVKMHFEASLSKTPLLTVTDGNFTVTTEGSMCAEKAINVPLSEEKTAAQLQKCGGTPYIPDSVDIEIDQNISLPAKVINEMRRFALVRLSSLRTESYKRNETAPEYIKAPAHSPRTPKASQRARFTHTDIPDIYKDFEIIFVPLFSKPEKLTALLDGGFTVGLEIPRGMFGKEEKIRTALKKAKELGISHILAGNLGAVCLAKESGFSIHGDFGLNLTNTSALLWAEEEGLEDAVVSFELTHSQINSLGGNIPRGIISEGYLPLMLTRACPGYTAATACKDCNKKQFLQDRLGKKFIFTCDGICTEILNSVPLHLDKTLKDFSSLDFNVFRFSVENSVEKVENDNGFSSIHQNSKDFTRGLYYRGVK